LTFFEVIWHNLTCKSISDWKRFHCNNQAYAFTLL